MEIIKIRLTDLEQNKGQVAGLPSNPRQWGRGELDNLVKSIQETPELLEARGLIVWPYGGKYIILGGNMRFSALREMNAVDAPCYVLPEDTPMEKLREIVIKNNRRVCVHTCVTLSREAARRRSMWPSILATLWPATISVLRNGISQPKKPMTSYAKYCRWEGMRK